MDDVEMSDVGAEAVPEVGDNVEPPASAAPGEKIMADSGVAATVSVSLHPLVIMNISEHWTRYTIQGLPKRRGILGKMPITGLGRGLIIKVMGVLKNSGNFQSNEHRNLVFLSKNDI